MKLAPSERWEATRLAAGLRNYLAKQPRCPKESCLLVRRKRIVAIARIFPE